MGGKDAAEGTGPPTGRDVLVSDADAIATGKSLAIIMLDLAVNDHKNKQAQLELSISPVTVATNEAYIIVVTQVDGETAGEAGTELGSFSFFPPPRQRRGPAVLGGRAANLARDEGCRQKTRQSIG